MERWLVTFRLCRCLSDPYRFDHELKRLFLFEFCPIIHFWCFTDLQNHTYSKARDTHYPLTPPWWQWQRHTKTKTKTELPRRKSSFIYKYTLCCNRFILTNRNMSLHLTLTVTQTDVSTRQLFQRLSLTLMRGNAALIMGRKPDEDFPAAEIDGVM